MVQNELWMSTKKPTPEKYRLPVLDRIRGAEFELTLEGTTLTTHMDLLMDPVTAPAGTVTAR